MNETHETLLTVPEVARRLRIGRTLAYRLVQTGEIPGVRVSRRVVRVRPRDLELFIAHRASDVEAGDHR